MLKRVSLLNIEVEFSCHVNSDQGFVGPYRARSTSSREQCQIKIAIPFAGARLPPSLYLRQQDFILDGAIFIC